MMVDGQSTLKVPDFNSTIVRLKVHTKPIHNPLAMFYFNSTIVRLKDHSLIQ